MLRNSVLAAAACGLSWTLLAAASPSPSGEPPRRGRFMIAPPPAMAIDEVVEASVLFIDRGDGGSDAERDYRFGSAGLVRAVESARSEQVWEGAVLDRETGRIGWLLEIATSQGSMVAWDRGDGSVIQAIPLGGGDVRILRRPGGFPGCFGAIAPESIVPGEGSLAGACDDGSTLDVLVKWTPNAESAAGGAAAIRAIAEASVALSNHVYAMSGVAMRMRAVGFGITEPFDGDAQSGVLTALRRTDDGILDGVHAERDALGADLVALLTGDHPSYCGVAYLLGTDSPGYGFSVTVWDCAVGNLTFPHEVGHNLGSCHAPGDGGGCTEGGVFPYSVGNRFVGASGTEWRTVMAYSPGTRWPRFSSPIVFHDGVPTGTADADNARTANETAATMANYRCSLPAPATRWFETPTLVPPVAGGSIEVVANGFPPAAPGSMVTASFSALADLNGSGEVLTLRLNEVSFGVVLGASGSECRPSSRDTLIEASAFNAALAAGGPAGEQVFRVSASGSVNSVCTVSELRFSIRYEIDPACGEVDGDGDGVADGCDACPDDPAKIAPGACGCGVADVDADGDGTPDCLESCEGDLTLDGAVGGADLALLLERWGESGGPADLTGDGLVDGADLGVLLVRWGVCP